MSGFSKFFGKKWIPIILLIIVSIALIGYSSSKGTVLDRMENGSAAPKTIVPDVPVVRPPTQPVPTVNDNAHAASVPQNVAAPSELLPTDKNSQWAALNPINQGNVSMPDLLQAGYHIGLDTIGQTLKNANLQLRSDPVIEKRDIGPWNQSTIEADYGRVPLEIGQGPR
jgi:hypothetical protein